MSMPLEPEEHPRGRPKSRGMRFTERFLLPFTGPAELGDGRETHPTTDEDRARDRRLRAELRRVTAPDGKVYLVERDITAPSAD